MRFLPIQPQIDIDGDISGALVLGDVHGNVIVNQPAAIGPTIPWIPLRIDQGSFGWLQWNTRLCDVRGQDDLISEILASLENSAGPFGLILQGEGGVGKSRLAAEVGERLRANGWTAGFIEPSENTSFKVGKNGIVLFIDYPEEKISSVRVFLKNFARLESSARIAVLLLTRSGPEFWLPILDDCGVSSRFSARPLRPKPLSEADAFEIFCSAQARVAELLQTTSSALTSSDFVSWLNLSHENRRPLFILSAAIHAVLNPAESLVGIRGADVAQALVRREMRRLRNEATANGLEKPTLARLAAIAAVRGTLSDTELEFFCGSRASFGFPSYHRLSKKLEDVGRFPGHAFEQPRPDILAACLVSFVFSEWPAKASEWIWLCIESNVESGLLRLGRLIYDAETTLGVTDFKLSAALARAFDGDARRCALALDVVVQGKLSPSLNELDVVVWKNLQQATSDEAWRGLALNNLSVAYLNKGDDELARKAAKDALEINKRLQPLDPLRYKKEIALNKFNLARAYIGLGRLADSISSAKEAVSLFEELSAARPGEYDGTLSDTLSLLTRGLAESGLVDEAVAVSRKAAQVVADSAEQRSFLCAALITQSGLLLEAGRLKEAVSVSNQALDMATELASSLPEVFEIDIARALGNLANILSRDDKVAALDAAAKSEAIFRRHAAAYPEQFLNDWLQSKTTLAMILDKNDPERAGDIIREVISRIEALSSPSVEQRLVLGRAYMVGASVLAVVDSANAEVHGEKGVALFEEVNSSTKGEYWDDLAGSLHNLAANKLALNKPREAVSLLQRSILLREGMQGVDKRIQSIRIAKSNTLLLECYATMDDLSAAKDISQVTSRLVAALLNEFPDSADHPLVRQVNDTLASFLSGPGA